MALLVRNILRLRRRRGIRILGGTDIRCCSTPPSESGYPFLLIVKLGQLNIWALSPAAQHFSWAEIEREATSLNGRRYEKTSNHQYYLADGGSLSTRTGPQCSAHETDIFSVHEGKPNVRCRAERLGVERGGDRSPNYIRWNIGL